jgi:elongator complex protein 3 (tRNA carboxymethyluridine synthase)
MNREKWFKSRQYTPEMLGQARLVLEDVQRGTSFAKAVRQHPNPQGGYLAKHVLVAAYRQLVDSGEWDEEPGILERIRMKPIRTLSGVTTVTVLTKPYPCPGKCIFCPTDERMPKSYLPDEPGARRGLEHHYDPFGQVSSRLEALQAVGHPVDKIELLVLGGSWCAYRKDYQEWFLKRCFDAMNGVVSASLEEAQSINESASSRNVGLVIETRPTDINPRTLVHLRMLGVTKVQMGAQSLDDRILALNQRGHTVQDTHQAVALLRAAGFKVVLHWMPNLLGATSVSDREDFGRLWDDLCPDEIKIYPTQLLANAELYVNWLRGEYSPYTTDELVELIADIKPTIPRYCRVNRVVRDIPSENVVAGNKRTSLRLDVQEELARRGTSCQCIRCREVRQQNVDASELKQEDLVYTAGGAEEHFISYVTPDDRLAGFLRLSLPSSASPKTKLADLEEAALIREVHVFGQSLAVGAEREGAAQHVGLGTQLLQQAEIISRQNGFPRLAVIAAVGTRGYYLERGFTRGELYLVKTVHNL